MAFVTEEMRNDELHAEITTVNRTIDEDIEDWRFIRLEVDYCGDRYTPSELIALGKWFIEQGSRISREYKRNGAKK